MSVRYMSFRYHLPSPPTQAILILSLLLAFHTIHLPSSLDSELQRMDLEDRKPQLLFDFEGFTVGEQTKVEDKLGVKQRKLYWCVSPNAISGAQLSLISQ